MPTLSRDPRDPRPLVLVADEDALVLELMQQALVQQHYRVITAMDGDEVVRRAVAERPDAVVLEARLPRRSGMEVCESLRHDPEDPLVPILLLTTSADTETRLEGLTRGADDVIGKPFSPKELVARLRRVLLRAGEARSHRRRADELEHSLGHAREDAARTRTRLDREQRLRELGSDTGLDLHGTLDEDALLARGLGSLQRRLGGSAVGIWMPDSASGEWRPVAFRGAGLERARTQTPVPDAVLVEWLTRLGHPVRLGARARDRELERSLTPWAAAGATLLVPLVGRERLEGVVASDDPADGREWSAADLDVVAALATLLASALRNARRFRAQQERALDWLAASLLDTPSARRAAAEGTALADAALTRLHLPPRERALVRHAVALAPAVWGLGADPRWAELAADDATRFTADLLRLLNEAEALDHDPVRLEWQEATMLVAIIGRHTLLRRGGRSRGEAWRTAWGWAGGGLTPALRTLLAAVHDEVIAA